MMPFKSVQRQKTKHSFEWLVLNWNVKLKYCHDKAEWFEARKSTQKRNNHRNATFFAPRLTEEKENVMRNMLSSSSLTDYCWCFSNVLTHNIGFHASWASMVEAAGLRRMSDDLKALYWFVAVTITFYQPYSSLQVIYKLMQVQFSSSDTFTQHWELRAT